MTDFLPTDPRAWRKRSAELPARLQPVLCAWYIHGAWHYSVAKFTGKRWLDVIPESANDEYSAPDYWQPIEEPPND